MKIHPAGQAYFLSQGHRFGQNWESAGLAVCGLCIVDSNVFTRAESIAPDATSIHHLRQYACLSLHLGMPAVTSQNGSLPHNTIKDAENKREMEGGLPMPSFLIQLD